MFNTMYVKTKRNSIGIFSNVGLLNPVSCRRMIYYSDVSDLTYLIILVLDEYTVLVIFNVHVFRWTTFFLSDSTRSNRSCFR